MSRFQSWYRVQPPALRALLTINVVVYLLWRIVFAHIDATMVFVLEHLALNPGLPGLLFEPWQLVSYNFLHLSEGLGGLLHILFNMLWLVWIGRDYEEMQGSHRLLAAYLIGGIGGGVLTALLHNLFPGVGLFSGIVHGASASVLGVMTAVAITYPFKSIALLFIGTVRLLYVVLGFLVLDILFLGGGTSITAHLGGALFGFLYARGELAGIDLSGWASVFFRRRRGRTAPPARSGSWLERLERWLGGKEKQPAAPSAHKRTATIHKMDRQPTRSGRHDPGEIDRILDKISEEGYDALSDEEKRALYEASKK